MGFSASLYQLVDSNAALATAIKSASLASLGNRTATSVAELAQLSATDWTTVLAANCVTLPPGTNAAQLGQPLATRLSTVDPIQPHRWTPPVR